ncbi:hypothetical protein V3C33_06505 [Micrococcaceae bacterium Sec5.7]
MTEPTENPGEVQPVVEWPESPGTNAAEADGRGVWINDPGVAALLGRLDGLPGLPVADHNAVYTEVHDALLEALNEDTGSRTGEA